MRALLLVALLVGCAPAVSQSRTARVVERPFAAKLHVFAHGWPGGAKLRTKMTLCPIDGAVFVCGGDTSLPVLRGDEIVVDPALIKGVALDPSSMSYPWIGAVTGSWPGNAWLRVDSLENEHTFYRWRTDRWVPVSSVHASHAALVPRPDGPLQITRDFEEEGPAWIKLEAPLGGHVPDPFTPSAHSRYDTDIAAIEGEVFVLDPSCPSQVIRFGAFTTATQAGEDTTFRGITNARGKIVAFGSNHSLPALEQLDTDRWLALDAHGLTAAVEDYARDARNEWAVADHKLYFRRDGGEFRTLDVPVEVERVWSTGDDDAWVFGTSGKEGVLLRTVAPSKLTAL